MNFRLKLDLAECVLVIVFAAVAALAFGVWQHSFTAGMFIFAILMLAMVVAIEAI